VLGERYRALLGRPAAASTFAASLVGRLPMGFASLAIVLSIRAAGGSFTVAGLAAGAFALAAALASPPLGRRVDRADQTAVVVPLALLDAGALLGLAAAARLDAPAAATVALAALSGAALPPLGACMRALWPGIAGDAGGLQAAYALESILQELVFIAGPLLAAALALVAPVLALVAAAGLVLGGSLAFARSPHSRAWRPEGRGDGLSGALGSPGLRTIVTATVGMSGAFGLIDVAMPAFASAHGSSAWAGVLVAVMAFASMLGGLWYGARRWSGPLDRRYVALFALFGAGLAPLAAADSIPAMVGLMALAGLAIAPVAACIYTLTADVALPGTSTEAFTWLSTSFLGGTAAGAALGGVVIDAAGVRAALLGASGSALLGAGMAALRRGTLRAAVVPAGAGLTAG